MTDEEMAVDWIRSQGWDEETLPGDEFRQMFQAFLAGLKAGKPNWHNWSPLGWDEETLPSDKVRQMFQVFLAGLKAGRPKWHKVADGDLPNKELEEKQLLVYEKV